MGERILVTGGAGFIASNVIRYFLKETDCEVVTLDRIDSSSDLSRIGQLVRDNPEYADRINVVWHDLKAEARSTISCILPLLLTSIEAYRIHLAS